MAVDQSSKSKKVAPVGDGQPHVWQRGRGFFHEVLVELKKTTWPTPKEAWRLTSVVIGVILIVAIYIGTIDAVLTFVTRKFGLIK